MAHESWLIQPHEVYVRDKPRQKKSTMVILLPIVKLNENGTDDCEDDQ